MQASADDILPPLLADPFAPTPLLHAALTPAARKRRRTTAAPSQPEPPADPAVAAAATAAAAAAAAADLAPLAAAAAAAPSTAPLAAETLAALQALRRPLRDASLSEETRAARCANGLQALLALTEPAAMAAACETVGFGALPDEAVLCACQAVAQPDISGRAAAAFVASVLRPRLAALEAQATRTLFSALLCLLQQHARALLDELIVPTLWHAGGALTAGQAEVLARLLKELPLPLLGRALSSFLQGEHGLVSGWSEAQVALLQAVLTRKPPLDAACANELVLQCDANVDALSKSLKFANLVSTLVRLHGAALRPHLPSVRRVAERLNTFMKKTILQALTKLEDAAA